MHSRNVLLVHPMYSNRHGLRRRDSDQERAVRGRPDRRCNPPDEEHGNQALVNFGSESELIFEPMPEGDSKRLCPEITRARKALGWGLRIPVREGLRKTSGWSARTHKHIGAVS